MIAVQIIAGRFAIDGELLAVLQFANRDVRGKNGGFRVVETAAAPAADVWLTDKELDGPSGTLPRIIMIPFTRLRHSGYGNLGTAMQREKLNCPSRRFHFNLLVSSCCSYGRAAVIVSLLCRTRPNRPAIPLNSLSDYLSGNWNGFFSRGHIDHYLCARLTARCVVLGSAVSKNGQEHVGRFERSADELGVIYLCTKSCGSPKLYSFGV